MFHFTRNSELYAYMTATHEIGSNAVSSGLHIDFEPVCHRQRKGHAVRDGLFGNEAELVIAESTAYYRFHLHSDVEADKVSVLSCCNA